MTFKQDFDEAIFEDEGGYGGWIVIRHFDTSRRSKYWNDITKEAVGGPPWEFTDTVTRAIFSPTFDSARSTSRSGVRPLESTESEFLTFRYFLRSDATIDVEDEVFELDHDGTEPPSSIDYEATGTGVKILNRYKVRLMLPYRGPSAVVQYKIALVDRSYRR